MGFSRFYDPRAAFLFFMFFGVLFVVKSPAHQGKDSFLIQGMSPEIKKRTQKAFDFLEEKLQASNKQHISFGNIEALIPDLDFMKNSDGFVTPHLQNVIFQIEKKYGSYMDPSAKALFQSFVARAAGRIATGFVKPMDQTPFFLKNLGPYHDYQSKTALPREVDVAIVGAGLTGASAAFFLSKTMKPGEQIALLDKEGVSEGASGRNGGIFGTWPQSFIKEYLDLVTTRRAFNEAAFPQYHSTAQAIRAREQARLFVQMGKDNAALIRKIVEEEKIDADFSDAGFLHIADSAKEEAALELDVKLSKEFDLNMEIWSAEKIFAETGIPTEFGGKFIRGFGNYHPYKFVNGLVESSLKRGLQLYTQTHVYALEKSVRGQESITLVTSRGVIVAKKVIIATDGYTSKWLPELNMVAPYQAQIVDLAGVLNRLKGITVTAWNGDQYFNGPRSTHVVDSAGNPLMTLHFGGAPDIPVVDADLPYVSDEVFQLVMRQVAEKFPDLAGRPPVTLSTGVFGSTPDRFPILGIFYRKGRPYPSVILSVGTQGFGGTMCVVCGETAAEMARGDYRHLVDVQNRRAPPKYFSMTRFTDLLAPTRADHSQPQSSMSSESTVPSILGKPRKQPNAAVKCWESNH